MLSLASYAPVPATSPAALPAPTLALLALDPVRLKLGNEPAVLRDKLLPSGLARPKNPTRAGDEATEDARLTDADVGADAVAEVYPDAGTCGV